MIFSKKVVEFEDVKELKRATKLKLTDVVTGNAQLRTAMVKHIGFFMYLALLVFFYIHNRYTIENRLKYKLKLSEQVKNLKAEATVTGAERMRLSSHTVVLKEIALRGLSLEESASPPTLLKAESD
ncbi:MAG: hypothetical protein LBS63_04575 [Prevotellaceae bacterium]|jgi:hypothetical protein|nr:hypothetical protein [Prevotellaceae bacterium]